MPDADRAAAGRTGDGGIRFLDQRHQQSRRNRHSRTQRADLAGLGAWPGASQDDARANIIALAHNMCDLVGQVRFSGVPGDPWKLGLAAFVSSVTEVRAAKGIPAAAKGYLEYGGAGVRDLVRDAAAVRRIAEPAGRTIPLRRPRPRYRPRSRCPTCTWRRSSPPGKRCPAITPARIAAQLMSMSEFDPSRLGPSGGQGIAQFQPNMWDQYAPSRQDTPWDANAAISALGQAMCDLVEKQMSVFPDADPYLLALASYEWGVDSVKAAGGDAGSLPVQDLLQRMVRYIDYYNNDQRLALAGTAPPPLLAPTPQPTIRRSQVQPSAQFTSPGVAVRVQPSATKVGEPAQPPTVPAKPTTTVPQPPATTSPAGPKNTLVGAGSGEFSSSAAGVDGTRLEIWTCDGTASQQWTFSGSTIRSAGLCMDAAGAGTANGTPVQVARCSGNPAQQFQLQSNGYVYSPYAGGCLDVYKLGTDNGAKLQLWDCANTTNQIWTLR